MKHSIENLNDVKNNANCKILKDFDQKYTEILKNNPVLIEEVKKGVDKGWKAIEYSPSSNIAKEIAKSKEYNEFIRENWANILNHRPLQNSTKLFLSQT